MAATALRDDVLEFLSHRPVKDGESVEYGWFIFRTIVENGCVDLETLDFKAMASFTRDLSVVERIHNEQTGLLRGQRVEAMRCCLCHAAIVSRSYVPGHPAAFMNRLDELEQNKSGWYIGIADDPLDVNDPLNLYLQSLYELSIQDHRFLPYWLLPVGYLIEFEGTERRIGRP